MKKELQEQGYKFLEDAFVAGFLMLLASAFLEFFFPGLVAFYVNTAWLFGLVLLLGAAHLVVRALYGTELADEDDSRLRLILARAAYVICALILLLVVIKLFAGILFLQVVVGLALLTLAGLVYSEFLL